MNYCIVLSEGGSRERGGEGVQSPGFFGKLMGRVAND